MTDLLALVRALGALLTVLGLLAGALWAVRRYNIVLPGAGMRSDKRLAVVERLSLDARRSLALLRRDGVEHLVLIAPEGHLVIETRIAAPPGLPPTAAAPVEPERRDAASAFLALVERARRSGVAPADVATGHDLHA